MAMHRNSGNDVYGVAPTVSSRMHGTHHRAVLDDRRINNMIGEAASRFSSHPTASSQSRYSTSTGVSYGPAPTHMTHVYGDRTSQSQYSTSTGVSYGAAPTHVTRPYGGRLERSREDLFGAAASVISRSTQATTAATTTTQYSTHSQIQSSPSTQANTTNTTRTPVRTNSYRYVTPETGSSQVTISPSYQNFYKQEISSNYYNYDTTAPMGIGEATIDLISNAGSSFWTLGRELFQGK